MKHDICITQERTPSSTIRTWLPKTPHAGICFRPVAYKLKSGETPERAAFELLGDKRLVNELHIVNGVAYVRGERQGPPAKWAAKPPDLGKR